MKTTTVGPHILRTTAVGRLRKLLAQPGFDRRSLSVKEKSGGTKRFPYHPNLALITSDILSKITPTKLRTRMQALYIQRMAPLVIEVYEQIASEKIKRFPNNYWAGWQGRLNMAICFRYVLETKCGIVMPGKGEQIDTKLLREHQRDFLDTHCEATTWNDFMQHYKLLGGFTYAFNKSIFHLMITAYPWAFDQTSPEGQHLHFDDFRQQGSRLEENFARQTARHRLEKHLGLEMDPNSGKIDPRLQRKGARSFLREKGFACWYDALVDLGLDSLKQLDRFEGKVGLVIRFIYPWAFDLSKPEGQHLHVHDYAARAPFSSFGECREALIHEFTAEGWDRKSWPQKATRKWLISRNFGPCLHGKSIFTFFQELFGEEFDEAAFSHQGSLKYRGLTAFRKIKASRTGTASSGEAHIDQVRYLFPSQYIGYFARKESSEHAVVYVQRRLAATDGGLTRIVISPNRIFKLIPGSKRQKVKTETYNRATHPVIPKEMKLAVLKLKVRPDNLSLALQIDLLARMNGKGMDYLPFALGDMGLIPPPKGKRPNSRFDRNGLLGGNGQK